MIYEIKKYGSEILRQVAEKVENIDDEILEILNNMLETLKHTRGVGLAAPQVGISKRIFICDNGEGTFKKVINPVITPLTDETISLEEGCLSVPGIYKQVHRIAKIKIEYLNEKGEHITEEVEGLLAIIMQHEYDHLNATLFIDRISPISKRMIAKKLQLLKKETLKQG